MKLGMAVAALLAGAVHAQMALPGEFAVSPVGTATYTVPIKLPPGVAGLQPSLSFNYDSANGPGLLGVGWQLSGLSAISRCPRTMAQDGVRGAIKFADTDRFCLDGARLMAVSGDAASYTSAGMEYRTEVESFSKIVSSAETDATAGPGSFTVRTKGGLTMEYGKTADSRIEAQGSTAVAVWALNKVTDVAGNHYTVTYTENNTNGEFYPASISYTGNNAAGLAPAFKVGFVYETRPDIAPAYLGGKLSKKTVRMKTLQIYSAGAVVNQYNISYAATSATRKRSAITTISYCDAAGVCIPSTAFATSAGNAAFTFWSQSITPGQGGANAQSGVNAHYFYDVSGDGRPDWIRVSRISDMMLVALAKPDGTFDFWTKQTATGGSLQAYQHHFVDINGDGKVDWVQTSRYSNSSSVGLSNGDGTFNIWSKQTSMTGNLFAYEHYLVDINGDGLPDWIQIERAGNNAWTALGKGDGSFDFWTKTFAAGSVNSSQHFFADINGDGMADWIRVSRESNNGYIALSKGDGSFDAWTSQSSAPGAWNNFWHDFADVNGDGKPDWIQVDRNTNTACIGLSKGDGTFEFWSKVVTAGNNGNFGHFLIDVNGDGRADWIQINRGDNSGGVALSNGDGTFNFWNFYSTVGQLSQFDHFFADINGDGRPDWIQVSRLSGNTGQIALSSAAPDGLLTGVTTATAGVLSIGYTTAAASLGDRYTRSTEVSYPRLSVPSTWPIVKSATRYTTPTDLHITNYWYDSATYELGTGRGFLGYAYTQEQDATTGLVNRTTWKLGFPLQGKPGLHTRGTTPTSHDNLGRVTYDYGCVDTGTGAYLDTCATETGHRYFVYPRLVQSSGNRDLTATGVPSAGLPGSAVSQTVDVWGNPLTVTAQNLSADGRPSGHSKSTTHQYAPADTSNWLLGRVLRSTVTSVSP